MATYSVWRDHASGTYEVVMWVERRPSVIQARIKSSEAAHRARDRWQAKEDKARARQAKAEASHA